LIQAKYNEVLKVVTIELDIESARKFLQGQREAVDGKIKDAIRYSTTETEPCHGYICTCGHSTHEHSGSGGCNRCKRRSSLHIHHSQDLRVCGF
jgi:hypothetical protein